MKKPTKITLRHPSIGVIETYKTMWLEFDEQNKVIDKKPSAIKPVNLN